MEYFTEYSSHYPTVFKARNLINGSSRSCVAPDNLKLNVDPKKPANMQSMLADFLADIADILEH